MGGLGWGKTLVNQLFQTCVYTVGIGLGKVYEVYLIKYAVQSQN